MTDRRTWWRKGNDASFHLTQTYYETEAYALLSKTYTTAFLQEFDYIVEQLWAIREGLAEIPE